jgi:hypothetical protein
MSRQEIYDPWTSIYWKHSNSSLQLYFEGYKEANSELWKRGENSTLRYYSGEIFTSLLSLHPFVL